MAANALTHTNSATTALDLNDGIVYSLLEGSPKGIFSVPYDAVTAETPRRRPRGILLDAQPRARTIQIDILVQGATRSAIITNIRALRAHFAVDGRDGSVGLLNYTADNAIQRIYKVTPWIDDSRDANSWMRSGAASRGWAIVTIQLVALDPTCYLPTAVTPSGALSGVANVNISCANAGDEDAWIMQMVIGAGGTVATNLKITDAYGTWLQFVDNVDAAETLTLVLDPQNLSFTHSVDGNWSGKRVTGSALPVIKYGTNNLVVQGDDAGDDATVTISFFSSYSGHG